MTEKNESAVEIALNRVEEAKKRRTRMSEGSRAEQVTHAENGNEVRTKGHKAIIKTLVYNKPIEEVKVDVASIESQRITDVKLKHFDEKSEKEFWDYTNKALTSAHVAKKAKARVQGA